MARSSTPVVRIEFAPALSWFLVLFGMWLSYVCSMDDGAALPYPLLMDPLKALGLFLFRSESGLRAVFWVALLAHIVEGGFAVKWAQELAPKDTQYIAFWFVQTALLGFPSLRIIMKQKAMINQKEEAKAAKAAKGSNKKK